MFDIRLDASEFSRWLRDAGERAQANARQTLGQGVALALSHAKATQKFKDRTGELRRSLTRGQRSTWNLYIRAGAKHAAYVEYGTKAHKIEARNGRTLRFFVHGVPTFRRSVNHPGTKPTHFMQEAADVGEAFLNARMEAAIQSAFR